jgi:aldehyde:ferredoxin oxidoreductase
MGTYFRRITRIDLSSGKIKDFEVKDKDVRDLLGGVGLASKLYLEDYDLSADPLSPANPLMIMAGPLVGTNLPGSGRFTVCARSPLTGIWGFGNAGGRFGPELKFTGRDGIIVEGAADSPVYIYVDEEEVRIEDAGDLWGRDAWNTEKLIQGKYPDGRKVQVLSIGPAGEHQVRFANLVHERGDFIGRCGLGAVAGSKNLKAVAVRGSQKKIKPALADEYKACLEAARGQIKEAIIANSLKAMGTNVSLSLGLRSGDVPIKNWSLGLDDQADATLGAGNYTKNYLTRGSACFACPVACKRNVEIKEGRYKTGEIPGPEYETVAMFGTMILNHDLEAIIHANNLINRLGMDSISLGSTLAFLMELWEKGIITAKDTDGLEFKWGDIETVIELLPKIARREGFGDKIAEGSKRLAKILPPESARCLTTVKGLEAPAHDPRALHGMGLSYAVSPRGACHIKHLTLYTEGNLYSHESVGLAGKIKGMRSEGKARLVNISENLGAQADAAVICVFVMTAIRPETYLDMLRTTTGFDYDMEEVLNIGRRIWTLERGITNIQGITATDDMLPEKLIRPPAEGPHSASNIDLELMLSEYYEIRGLDEKGRPSQDVCQELGLDNLAEKLKALR